MRKLWTMAALVCGVTLLSAAAFAADAGLPTVDAAWMKAMKANSLDAVLACYAPDAVMWFPEAPEARGTNAIREIYKAYFDTYTVTDATLSNTSYLTYGDVSTGWGNFVLTLKPKKGGETVVLKGRFTGVAKQNGGKWAYVSDHASATPAPPPAKP